MRQGARQRGSRRKTLRRMKAARAKAKNTAQNESRAGQGETRCPSRRARQGGQLHAEHVVRITKGGGCRKIRQLLRRMIYAKDFEKCGSSDNDCRQIRQSAGRLVVLRESPRCANQRPAERGMHHTEVFVFETIPSHPCTRHPFPSLPSPSLCTRPSKPTKKISGAVFGFVRRDKWAQTAAATGTAWPRVNL
jgi:hypothetical protein